MLSKFAWARFAQMRLNNVKRERRNFTCIPCIADPVALNVRGECYDFFVEESRGY